MAVAGGVAGHRHRPPVVLCGCGCHAACPLMNRGVIAEAVWERRCACPGTEQARRNLGVPRRDHGDFAGVRERARRERQEQRAARDEAFDAARAAAGGKTRAEIRDIYMAQLRARGLPVPPDEVLDACADAITGGRRRMPVSFPGLILTGIGKELGELGKLFRNVGVFHKDG